MDIASIFSAMAGSFFGVIIAFALNYVYQYNISKKDKEKYKKMIRSEIELCIRVLSLDKVRLLSTERWTLAINAGALRLFDLEVELEPLNENYLRIDYYNKIIKNYMGNDWTLMCNKFAVERDLLLNDLKRLMDAEWFK